MMQTWGLNPKVIQPDILESGGRDRTETRAAVAEPPERTAANHKEAPAIFVLDDDPDILDSMVAVVHGLCKRPCITAASVKEMVDRSKQVLLSELAFLDINLGADSPSGVDGYRWLRKHRYAGRVIFFTGHAQSHPHVQEAKRLGVADVVQKPVPLGRS